MPFRKGPDGRRSFPDPRRRMNEEQKREFEERLRRNLARQLQKPYKRFQNAMRRYFTVYSATQRQIQATSEWRQLKKEVQQEQVKLALLQNEYAFRLKQASLLQRLHRQFPDLFWPGDRQTKRRLRELPVKIREQKRFIRELSIKRLDHELIWNETWRRLKQRVQNPERKRLETEKKNAQRQVLGSQTVLSRLLLKFGDDVNRGYLDLDRARQKIRPYHLRFAQDDLKFLESESAILAFWNRVTQREYCRPEFLDELQYRIEQKKTQIAFAQQEIQSLQNEDNPTAP